MSTYYPVDFPSAPQKRTAISDKDGNEKWINQLAKVDCEILKSKMSRSQYLVRGDTSAWWVQVLSICPLFIWCSVWAYVREPILSAWKHLETKWIPRSVQLVIAPKKATTIGKWKIFISAKPFLPTQLYLILCVVQTAHMRIQYPLSCILQIDLLKSMLMQDCKLPPGLSLFN